MPILAINIAKKNLEIQKQERENADSKKYKFKKRNTIFSVKSGNDKKEESE